MLEFETSSKYDVNCNVTHGAMGHLDPKQPPLKRKPFAAILNQKFIQKVELILPIEIYEVIHQKCFAELSEPFYNRVILPLQALVEGDFFNDNIKRGNILMRSEGYVDNDNVYFLKEGTLTLYLDKESYERAGIVGKPYGVKGTRGSKPRWVVEIDLRQPSMLHGKRGFDRIVYAFKNVLTVPVIWLFIDLGTKVLMPSPLDIHFPVKKVINPMIEHIDAKMPSLIPSIDLASSYADEFEDYAVEVHEWISMIQLSSPRLNPQDNMDTFLSRYAPGGESPVGSRLVKIAWRGFLSPSWAHKLFVQILLAAPREAWFVYAVASFGEEVMENCRDCTILKLPDTLNGYVSWEMV